MQICLSSFVLNLSSLFQPLRAWQLCCLTYWRSKNIIWQNRKLLKILLFSIPMVGINLHILPRFCSSNVQVLLFRKSGCKVDLTCRLCHILVSGLEGAVWPCCCSRPRKGHRGKSRRVSDEPRRVTILPINNFGDFICLLNFKFFPWWIPMKASTYFSHSQIARRFFAVFIAKLSLSQFSCCICSANSSFQLFHLMV